ncbi:MAG: hypothetical protein HQK50_06350 [Oligoflexia bacterium]|nr:hypothetical protein [Oligoflexia bacterium]MBF0365172.1 hypothetical protein [Oligoflexia bacterium]
MGKVVDFDLELFRSLRELQDALRHIDAAIMHQEQSIAAIKDRENNCEATQLQMRLSKAKTLRKLLINAVSEMNQFLK